MIGGINDKAPHSSIEEHVVYALIFCLFWVALHIVLDFVIKRFYKDYEKLESHVYHDYRMYWCSIIHSVFASLLSIYCMFLTCPGDQTFYNSEECRLVVRNSHVWLTHFTASNLVIDTILILVFMGLKTTFDKQMIVHHVVAFTNYYIAFWQQDFVVTIGAAFIFLEISTPFVCARWLLFHHGYKGTFW